MKTRNLIIIAIPILLLVGFLFTAGRVKHTRVTEPAEPSSTILIGRITLTCVDFPKSWNINGDHATGVKVWLGEKSSSNPISIMSKGTDGLFYFLDPTAAQYAILGFEYMARPSAQQTVTLGFRALHLFDVQGASVNNLGDMIWRCQYGKKEGEEYTKSAHQTYIKVIDSIEYKGNYDEVKAWFEEIYHESGWIGREWVDVKTIVMPVGS